MAKVFIDETTLTAIGNAIREKEGSVDPIPVVDMASRIRGASGGGSSYYTAGLEYSLDGGGYAVVGRGTAPTSGTIRIPPTYQGLPVVKVSAYGCSGCENIIVPDSVITLAEYAFDNVGGYIYIPKGVANVSRLHNIAYHASGRVAPAAYFVEWTTKPSGWAEDWNVYTEPTEGDFEVYTYTGCITDLFELNKRRRY